jgi:hypothetical protein
MVRFARLTLVVIAVLASAAVPASAQDAIVLAAAPIYVYPDSARTPLRTAAADTRLRVVEERADGWVRVEFQDPQYGRRVGYVESRFLRIVRPNEQPLDLSVPEAPEAAPAPTAVPLRQPADAHTPGRLRRGWIDVNIGGAFARETTYADDYTLPVFEETARGRVDYHFPAGASFDFGGGVMLTREFGLGVSFAGTAHQDTADLFLRVPHPLYFDSYAEDRTVTDGDLQRIESQTNIQAMFAADVTPSVRVRVFAGPTFFRARQDVVTDVGFNQQFGVFTRENSIDITTYETTLVDFDEASGWGVHAGADVSWFFSGVVGVGAFGRYASGTVEYVHPLTLDRRELKVGGFQGGGGLRLRF